MTTPIYDSFNRTSTFCISASIPTREVNHWVKKLKEVFVVIKVEL
jgi:hypothetical protein